MKLTEKKIESTPLLQMVKRSNFIRAAAMEWMRINQPDLMAEIEAEAERQYPFTKAAVVGPLHNGPVVNATHRIARPSSEVAGTGLVQIDGDG
jgi:hypothetical protein